MSNFIERINTLITGASNKNQKITELQAQLEECQNSLIEKETEVNQLTEQLNTIQAEVQTLENEVVILQEQNNQLNLEKQENDQLLSELDTAITRLEEVINGE